MRPGRVPTTTFLAARLPALGAGLAALALALAMTMAASPAALAVIPQIAQNASQVSRGCPARTQAPVGGAQVDIDAIATGPGCAVYAAGTVSLSESTALFSWNGSTWKHIPSFTGGEFSNLYAVTAPSAASTWAVGYTDNSVADQTLIQRKTARGWITYGTPNPAGPVANNDLYGVAAAGSSAWAVGAAQTVNANTYAVLILGWTGRKWVVTHAPKVARAQDSALFSVAAVSAASAWAVGTAISGSVSRPLIERLQHGKWAVAPSPAAAGELESVTVVSAGNAWAVGYRTAAGLDKTLVEHWNGSKWSVVTSPNVLKLGPRFANNQLRCVAATSAKNAYAVGVTASSGHPNNVLTLLLHWNGQTWARVSSPDPAGSGGRNELQGVAASGLSGFWIVGRYLAGGVWHSFALHK
jgi:hypothetical protein